MQQVHLFPFIFFSFVLKSNKVNLSLPLLPKDPGPSEGLRHRSSLIQVEGRITKEPSYPRPSFLRLFKETGFKGKEG